MAVAIAWLPGPAGTRRRVAKPSVEEPDAAEPARPDLWGARVSNDPGLPDHDRDPLFRPAVRDTLPPADVTPIRLPARSPNLHAYTERFVRTIKESCLERMVLIGEGSLRRAVREFVAHYHHERNHQGLDNRLILPLSTAPPPRGRVPVPPAARWDVELLLSVSSVIHDRPLTPRSSFWTIRVPRYLSRAFQP